MISSNLPRVLVFLSLTVAKADVRWDRFSTKTSYFWHKGAVNASTPVKNEYMSFKFHGKTCQAIHINALIRHGSEYPAEYEINETMNLHNMLQSLITNPQYNFMKGWTNPFSQRLTNSLLDLGKEEHHYLGKSYATRLFDFFQRHLNNIKYITSDTNRTKNSARAFHGGLSKVVVGKEEQNIVPQANDHMIRYYDFCPLFAPLIDHNETLIHAFYDFEKTPHYKKMMDDVSRRLGFKATDLQPVHYKNMFKACTYELGVYNRTDNWCALQTDEDREVLEYDYDLLFYYLRGYGQNFSRQMSCPLVRDFFQGMDTAVDMHAKGMNYTPIVIRVGHSDTRGPFYDAIGIFKDDTPLRADNFDSMRNRKYKCSHTGPFAANLMFVLYSCHGNSNHGGFLLPVIPTSTSPEYAIRMFVNEEPHVIPACNSDTCWYKDVRDGYRELVDTCHFNDLCALATSMAPLTTNPSPVNGVPGVG